MRYIATESFVSNQHYTFTCQFLSVTNFILNLPTYIIISQIHEYMLSKAPPVPQINPSPASEDHPSSREDEVNGGSQTAGASQNAGAMLTGEGVPSPAADDRIVEEVQEAPLNANPTPELPRVLNEAPSGGSSRLVQKPEMKVQKPTEDRLFTLAAVGLTIAILVLLLKKFMKSSGHGAVFMDES